jgi:hypothetical protein
VEKARNRSLNPSRITEQAVSGILDHLEEQSIRQSSESLTRGSLPGKLVGPIVQPGMNAAFAMRKSRVQIPLGPLKQPYFRQTRPYLPFSLPAILYHPYHSTLPSATESWSSHPHTRAITNPATFSTLLNETHPTTHRNARRLSSCFILLIFDKRAPADGKLGIYWKQK